MDDDDLIEWLPGANTEPPVLLLQGTGGTNQEILTFGRRLAPQSPLMTVAGRQGIGAQRQYFRQTAAGAINAEQVATEAQWIGRMALQMCTEQHWESQRLVVIGYSNGAAMAAYGVQTGAIPATTAVLFHPLWLAAPSIQERPDLAAWLSAGRRDPLVSVGTVSQVESACKKTGGTTKLEVTNGSHQLTPQEVLAARLWLTRQIGNS
ncbi:esterase [Levilactobacillus senmaizukei DSM 21775 = NBRC 103853]|uniref:Esterase n=1 Tax=Levilactobacillus senmaizukei DSM 21775 = NBRC 103853 TaxID=1423803 RepID=A0A0R2DGX9_9LACO|nr:dienelactone hydrolase family protein [Levilactobacillus senmaizukei]KRN03314.1 esterase [Levilactobacillus senmaizukei DSM 21775 = NBRC 103853]